MALCAAAVVVLSLLASPAEAGPFKPLNGHSNFQLIVNSLGPLGSYGTTVRILQNVSALFQRQLDTASATFLAPTDNAWKTIKQNGKVAGIKIDDHVFEFVLFYLSITPLVDPYKLAKGTVLNTVAAVITPSNKMVVYSLNPPQLGNRYTKARILTRDLTKGLSPSVRVYGIDNLLLPVSITG